MKAPSITPNFIPSLYQQGFMLEELHRTLPDGTPCIFTQRMNHIITDQEQCAINQKFFEAAPKMAEAMEKIMKEVKPMMDEGWKPAHTIFSIARSTLLLAGYTEN